MFLAAQQRLQHPARVFQRMVKVHDLNRFGQTLLAHVG
jgi:hypothetical protein